MNGRVRVIAETGSTNADLRALAADWPEGQWLRAERQTAGRGRLGRAWESQSGNLQASTVIRLRRDDPPVSGLGLLMGVIAHSAVSALAPNTGAILKWPNDLMIGQAKLAGMLLEREGDAVIAGIGVNVASAPEIAGRQTIALTNCIGAEGLSVDGMMEYLVFSFDRWLAVWREKGNVAIIQAWMERAHPAGTQLSITTASDRPQQGRFVGLDRDGALILGLDNGTTETFHSGDVGLLD